MAAAVLPFNNVLSSPTVIRGTVIIRSKPTAYMMAISDILEHLGLSQYHDSFVAEAFDTWEVLVDIKEADLAALNVKLGHRRVLQRAISEYRRSQLRAPQPLNHQTLSAKTESAEGDGDLAADPKSFSKAAASGDASGPTGVKRKYRRHPRPDGNAPDRPPSAYVLFSNRVRHTLKDRDFSFTEIAKIVGEKWQVLPPDEKETFEGRSQIMKERYYHELADYKKTREYAEYQEYLADFKAKHDPAALEGKRSRKDDKQSGSRRSNSIDRTETETDHQHNAKWTYTERDGPYSDRRRSEANPPTAQSNGFSEWRFRGTGAVFDEAASDTQARSVVDPVASPACSPTLGVPLISPTYPSPVTAFRPADPRYTALIDNPAEYASVLGANFMRPSNAPYMPIETATKRALRPIDAIPSLAHSETAASTPSSRTSSSNVPPPVEHARALPNRHLPPPIPSRPMHLGQDVPPPLATSVGKPNPSSGFATLLYAGEQLATKPPLGREAFENGRRHYGSENGHDEEGRDSGSSSSHD